MQCPICSSNVIVPYMNITFLNKYKEQLHLCRLCNFSFVPNPYFIEEAYSIDYSAYNPDTGRYQRNYFYAQLLDKLSKHIDMTNGILNYGCGDEELLTKCSKLKILSYDKYVPRLSTLNDEHNKCDLLIATEVAEHIPCYDIDEFWKFVFKYKVSVIGTKIFTEPPQPSEPYLAKEYGQHISFYSR